MWGDGQGGSRGAVRGGMVIAAEAAYAEGKAGDEADRFACGLGAIVVCGRFRW